MSFRKSRKYTKEEYDVFVELHDLGYKRSEISKMTGINIYTISSWLYGGRKPYQAWTEKEKKERYENSGWNKGLTAKEDSRILSGENHPWYGKKLSEDHRKKLSLAAKKPRRLKIFMKNRFPDSIKGKDHPNYGRERSEKTREKIRKARKKQRFPKNKTKPERKLIKIIDKYRLQLKYVGDGAFWIGDINPDFINKENRTVVEVFGDYWHDPTLNENLTILGTEDGRQKYLETFQWNLIVLWESDINEGEKTILSKLCTLPFIENNLITSLTH